MRTKTFTITLFSICALSASALAQQATPAWYSGFETGFPGESKEWLDWTDGSFTASGTANTGFAEAWSIVSGGDITYAGGNVYKGWPVAPKPGAAHRAYPVIHVDIPTPLVNSMMVYLDIDYAKMAYTDWVHFATWGNNPDWSVHTLSVRDRKLEMAHLDWRYVGPGEQPDFPLRRWVRLTAYIHYDGGKGYVRLWQDGVPTLEGTYTQVAGTNLMRAHWGWYSNGEVAHGVQYNDEIQIWTLDAPLRDLVKEPASPYPNAPGGGTSAGSGGASGGSSGVTPVGGRAGAPVAAVGGASGGSSGVTPVGGRAGAPVAAVGGVTSGQGGATSSSKAGTTSTTTAGRSSTRRRIRGGAWNRFTAQKYEATLDSDFEGEVDANDENAIAAGAKGFEANDRKLGSELEQADASGCSQSGNADPARSAWLLVLFGGLMGLATRRKARA